MEADLASAPVARPATDAPVDAPVRWFPHTDSFFPCPKAGCLHTVMCVHPADARDANAQMPLLKV